MKKYFLLVAVALIFAWSSATTSAANYTTNAVNVISINPFSLIDGLLNVTFEHKLSAKNSLTVNASYWGYESYATGIGIGASYRWYIDLFEEGKSATNGLSIGPRLQYYHWSYSWDNDWADFSYSSLSLGVEIAYKWVFDNKWVVEPTLNYSFPIVKKSGYSFTDYGFGVNLGYAF
ncbi:MAG: DUF3575 domain-containing protein [Ignavibacteria bacterium]|jgi:hypothetical protein|nr:DUF3575 domain-containing protein [Ignavibacteria bacterium]